METPRTIERTQQTEQQEVSPTALGRRRPLSQRDHAARRGLSRLVRLLSHPVPAAMAVAAALHLLFLGFIGLSGGDIAAQDAWAEFARSHPDSAYNLSWYGGVHPISYSVISPYVMAAIGVRATLVIAGTVSAGLLALLLVRSSALAQPRWPALYGALALTGNAISGRVTFALGVAFGLGAVVAVTALKDGWATGPTFRRRALATLTACLSALATAASPIAGLFLGIVAAATWLEGRRRAAYLLGLPPVAVVLLSTLLFPFSGEQPIAFYDTILPVVAGVCGVTLAPPSWRTVRIGSALYVVAMFAAWLIPSPIGSNMTRLGLIFGGVLLVAIASQDTPLRRPVRSRLYGSGRWTAVVLAIVTMSIWQVGMAAKDAVTMRPDDAWSEELMPVVDQLQVRDADQGRVEVVPSRSHREAAALTPYINLARGWNRQADAERNPIFYEDGALTAKSYRTWLDRWAVHYVLLSNDERDPAAVDEAELVARTPGYLREVWSDSEWRLFAVKNPTPLADPPAAVVSFAQDELVLSVPAPGTVRVRIPYSPWLSLVDAQGGTLPAPEVDESGTVLNRHGCLSEDVATVTQEADDQVKDVWTLLYAPEPGTYRIAAPYTLPRGTECPDELTD
jgi:hypothetical protein